VTWVDPKTGLELVADIREYNDFPAIEWTLHFSNGGAVTTPLLESVQAFDHSWSVAPLEAVVLHRLLGCTSTVADFAPVTDIIVPGFKARITPIGGRSSNLAMPFFMGGRVRASLSFGLSCQHGQHRARSNRDGAHADDVASR